MIEWLQRQTGSARPANATPLCFIPRGVYGAYVASLARELLECGVISHVRGCCVSLIEARDTVTLNLDLNPGKKSIVADWVILATGNDPKPALAGIPAVQPWTEGSLSGLAADAPILIIGSGLTMVDMTLSLDRRGHRGKITALSPRGLLSLAHRPAKPLALAAGEVPFGGELSTLTAWLRGLAMLAAREGGDWRSAIDALRPHTQRLWRSMSLIQKQRFLRHARPYWDVHRHRMAPEVEAQICALRAAERLDIVAGRIVSAVQRKNNIAVEIAPRGGAKIDVRNFARLIDCTGLANDPHQSNNPLICSLLASGAARPDPLGIGLDIDEDYALIGTSSQPSKRVRAVGPLARAAFWECIAIPDIRLQCRELAEMVAGSASGRRQSPHTSPA